MKNHKIILSGRKLICDNTVLFNFKNYDADYYFKAGQYAFFTIPEVTYKDEKGNSRAFSFAGSPLKKGEISIAARLSNSKFVKHLNSLPLKSEIYISEPKGHLNEFIEKELPFVFIAGGTGITPVRSLIEDAVLSGKNKKLTLFYSNKTESQSAFLDDFFYWESIYKDFRFIPVIEDENNNNWKHEFGNINIRLLKKFIGELKENNYIILGPPHMVSKIENELLESGVNPGNLYTEKIS